MVAKCLINKGDKLMSYQEYIETFCPKSSENELLSADSPSFVGSSLAKMTIDKIRHQLLGK